MAGRGARWRQRVGIVLQGTGEFDELTVGEVVRHFARFYDAPDAPDAVIERVGLADKVKARTRSASSAGPSCCSSTSRRPVSTRRRGASSGH